MAEEPVTNRKLDKWILSRRLRFGGKTLGLTFVRYEAVNAMLLNEFLKARRKVEQLTKNFESKLAEQQKRIDALTAGLQKVTAQLELSKVAPQTVLNKQ